MYDIPTLFLIPLRFIVMNKICIVLYGNTTFTQLINEIVTRYFRIVVVKIITYLIQLHKRVANKGKGFIKICCELIPKYLKVLPIMF